MEYFKKVGANGLESLGTEHAYNLTRVPNFRASDDWLFWRIGAIRYKNGFGDIAHKLISGTPRCFGGFTLVEKYNPSKKRLSSSL